MERLSPWLLTFLLNACWQAALLAVVALCCARLLRGTPARQQHLLWVATLVLSVCLPVLSSYATGAPAVADSVLQRPSNNQRVFEADAPPPLQTSTQTAPPAEARTRIRLNKKLAGLLLISYGLFLLYRAVRLYGAWRKTRTLVRGAQPAPIPAHVRALIEQYQCALVGGAVEICCSPSVAVPVTVGARRPRIIVPEGLLAERDADVWAAAVGHELAHIRRRDYVCNLLYELLQLPLAFHPALTLVRRRIGETRELACDELVTERLLGAQTYARSLMHLANSIPALQGHHTTTTTLGINGANILEERIMTLLGRKTQLSLRRKKFTLLAVAVALLIACVAATTFALQIGLDRYDAAASLGQEQKQEHERAEAQEVEAHRKREREEKMKRMKEGQEKGVVTSEEPEMSAAEREARVKHEQTEREERAKTIKEAKLTMAQAIQIATNAQAGTVLNSNLERERNQPCYRIVIVSGDEPNITYTIMLVSALDGQILVSKTEH
jgi:beta-lactamase regulating signal transducer with metallopeptidase domain/uncharacterized membrane protein YkoI